MSCLRLHSRAGVPTAPRKYLVVTMVVAFIDHEAGNSTPFCSKIVSPDFQFVWTTSRRSHSTSSYGWTPGVVNTRSMVSPRLRPLARPVALPVLCEVSVMSFLQGPPVVPACGHRELLRSVRGPNYISATTRCSGHG